jgi:hypothetical protein
MREVILIFRILTGLSLSTLLSVSVLAQNAAIEGLNYREHGDKLETNIKVVAGDMVLDPYGDADSIFYVSDDHDFLERARDNETASAYVKEVWEINIEPVCGLRGEDQVLVALDDDSGTPTDFTRQVMLASDMSEPLKVFVGLDYVQALTISRLHKTKNYNIGFVMNGGSFQSDGRSLSALRREGQGMAFVDARHANAPGFATALTIGDNDDSNVPSVQDLDIPSVPPRFATLYVGGKNIDDLKARAEQACQMGGERYMSLEEVVTAQEQLWEMHYQQMQSTNSETDDE